MQNILKIIGSNIKHYRTFLGLSQEKLAELSGLHRTYVGAVERGERNISLKNIDRLAKVLAIEPYLLLKKKSQQLNEMQLLGTQNAEEKACVPKPVSSSLFNPKCILPYNLTTKHIEQAMNEFLEFLGFVNYQLYEKGIPRLESFLMPANFSSMVGEFMNITIPKYSSGLSKNQYHNGHPDLLPMGRFLNDAVQHSHEGIEVKGSRHSGGWQGHNPESVWLMVFYFDSNTSNDKGKGISPKPFRFKGIYAAKLNEKDWTFSGRSATSRRTITASVNKTGVDKMKANWIYEDLRK